MEIFSSSFWGVALAAFLGGLVLNVMPCVLPVLALKFYTLAGKAKKQSLWLIIGIVVAFNLFAALIYLLQQAGAVVGWGFHFQQPLFVLLMMSLLLFFVFSMINPLSLSRDRSRGGGGGGRGIENFAHNLLERFEGHERLSNLFYGMVIVGLATPCTAPFLGSAVAFALTQGLAMIFLIFTAIALGLATPWIGLILFPQIVERAIAVARQNNVAPFFYYATALMLYASVLWLFYVLVYQLGALPAVITFLGIHLVFFFWQRIKFAPIFLALIITYPLVLPHPAPAPVPATAGEIRWQPFDAQEIQRQQAKGKKVFVDITAKWCITCQFNKKNVLSDPVVRQRLSQADVYLMQGDLTKPNPTLTAYIKSHHRIGIPFNALYSRAGGGGVYLFSELLDKETLLTQLNR